MLDPLVRRLALPLDAKAQIVSPRKLECHFPSVSVLIPCYNYGQYLPQCVTSALAQKGVQVDILIIDDASTDGSDQIVRRLGTQDPRIRTICHTANKGHIATYNEGLKELTGEYTVVISADDLLTPGCLARATSLMEAYPSVGLTYGVPIDFTTGSIPPARTNAKSWIVWQGHDWITQRCKKGANALKSPEAVIRTSVLREIGGFRSDLPLSADFELWMRLAAVSDIGYVAGADQAYYRNHAAAMHNSRFDMLDDFSQRLACFDAIFSQYWERLEDPSSMRDTAHRMLARNALSYAMRDIAYQALDRSLLSHMRGYARSAAGHEPARDYAVFALKAWPDARDLDEWKALDRSLDDCDNATGLSFSLVAHVLMRRIRGRVAYYRWRRAGM